MKLESKYFKKEAERINRYTELFLQYLEKEKRWEEMEEILVALSIVQDLLFLYETYGEVSSVVSWQEDPEYNSLKTLYDLYAQIKLKEHVRNVLREALDYFENEKKVSLMDPMLIDNSFGNYLTYTLMALGHDLGKVPEVRARWEKNGYSMGDHAYYSYLYLTEKLKDAGLEIGRWEHVLRAVREHHFPPKDRWVKLLKTFDQKAREREGGVVKVRVKEPELFSPAEEVEVPEWLDETFMEEVLKNLKEYVNVRFKTDRRYKGKISWVAVSQSNGLVYVHPDFLLDLTRSIAIRRGIKTPVWFFDDSEKLKGMIAVNKALSQMEASLVPSGRAGIRATVKIGKSESYAFLLPIQASAFSVPVSFFEEKRKKDSLLRQVKIEIPATSRIANQT